MSRKMQRPIISADLKARAVLLAQLDESLEALYNLYRNLADPETDVYQDWTAREILGHLTFWHESFARNVSDLAHGRAPSPLKGKYVELNQRSVEEMGPLTTAQVTHRLRAAQQVIQEHILSEDLGMIPYRKGSRDYSPEEHLEIVNEHIRAHMKALQKAQR
jgi:hypothetical protein